jgi:hypothetical protein
MRRCREGVQPSLPHTPGCRCAHVWWVLSPLQLAAPLSARMPGNGHPASEPSFCPSLLAPSCRRRRCAPTAAPVPSCAAHSRSWEAGRWPAARQGSRAAGRGQRGPQRAAWAWPPCWLRMAERAAARVRAWRGSAGLLVLTQAHVQQRARVGRACPSWHERGMVVYVLGVWMCLGEACVAGPCRRGRSARGRRRGRGRRSRDAHTRAGGVPGAGAGPQASCMPACLHGLVLNPAQLERLPWRAGQAGKASGCSGAWRCRATSRKVPLGHDALAPRPSWPRSWTACGTPSSVWLGKRPPRSVERRLLPAGHLLCAGPRPALKPGGAA